MEPGVRDGAQGIGLFSNFWFSLYICTSLFKGLKGCSVCMCGLRGKRQNDTIKILLIEDQVRACVHERR